MANEQIASVKGKVEASQSYGISTQKLIFRGKILVDTALVSSLGITEKDFIVCMVTKVF